MKYWPFVSEKKFEELKRQHVNTLKEFKEHLINDELHKPIETEKRYVTIKSFEKSNNNFVKNLSDISDSEEMAFMLYDLKQQCVENMINGNVEVNIQMTGIIKGIDLVIKNLAGYKLMWKSILSENKNDREI
jgi:hypothetical protein